MRDHVCHINYMIGKAFYNPFVIIWCGSPNVGVSSLESKLCSLTPSPLPPPPNYPHSSGSTAPSLPPGFHPPFHPSRTQVWSQGPSTPRCIHLTFLFWMSHHYAKCFWHRLVLNFGLLWWLKTVKNLRPMQETQDWPPGSGRFPWRREWLPTPVCLPGEFHGQRKLVGYRPWGSKGLATTENSTFTYSLGALFSYLTKAGEIV